MSSFAAPVGAPVPRRVWRALRATPAPWLRNWLLFLALSGLGALPGFGQRPRPQVFFTDIDQFWVAYDSMRTTPDSLRQLNYLQRLYLDRGTAGLRAFQQAKGYTAPEWVAAVRRYPRFWQSIRPNTQLVRQRAQELTPYLRRLARLYPALRPAGLYFTVGALRSAGTTQDGRVLIGAELATGTLATDISEFAPGMQAFLARYFRSPQVLAVRLSQRHLHAANYLPDFTFYFTMSLAYRFTSLRVCTPWAVERRTR